MSCFSQEYCKITGLNLSEFSYIDLFSRLDEGEYLAEICEGLGTFGIHRRSGIPYLVVSMKGDLAEYTTFLKNFQDSLNQKEHH